MGSPWLAAELEDKLARRVQVNNVHHVCIQEIYSFCIYNGMQDPGTSGPDGPEMQTPQVYRHMVQGLDDSGDTVRKGIYPQMRMTSSVIS